MRKRLWIALITAVVAVAACGGGGGGGSGSSGGSGSGSSSNTAPVADAGAQQNVLTGAAVRLDGRNSRDADDDRIFYEWTIDTKPSGSNATLTDRYTVVPLFQADVEGDYVVSLRVSDDIDFSQPDTVKVVAASPNSAPVADAGESFGVKTGMTVELDGSASRDGDDQELAYRWTITSQPGTGAQLAESDTASPSFAADTTGTYVVQLVVNDGDVDSEPDEVTISATAGNVAPVADAGGDQGVSVGATVTLDGSASTDIDDSQLDYAWLLVSAPVGSGAELTSKDMVTSSFVADSAGGYVVQLTASDASGASDSDRIVITAGPRLELSADLDNDGTFEPANLSYDQTYGPTITQAPDQGFVLGRFRLKAIDGSFLLANLSFDVDAEGAYVAAFDGFQAFTDAQQVLLPAGETVEFTLNLNVPANSQGFVTYGFTVVQTGETFEASYMVESNDN